MKESLKDLLEREKKDKLKIASFNLWEKLTVRKLNMTRGTIQRAYRTMKEKNFKGDVIDYLCYESLEEFVANIVVGIEVISSFKKTFEYAEAYLDINKDISVPIFRLLLKDEDYLVQAFKNAGVDIDDKRFIESKKLLNRKMTALMNNQLRILNKSNKLIDG